MAVLVARDTVASDTSARAAIWATLTPAPRSAIHAKLKRHDGTPSADTPNNPIDTLAGPP